MTIPDVIYIATLARDHLAHAKLCMTHGKNVLCEKPLGVNVQQVKELVECAKKNNVFFMEVLYSYCTSNYKQFIQEKW